MLRKATAPSSCPHKPRGDWIPGNYNIFIKIRAARSNSWVNHLPVLIPWNGREIPLQLRGSLVGKISIKKTIKRAINSPDLMRIQPFLKAKSD
jgi:hypothetical protein